MESVTTATEIKQETAADEENDDDAEEIDDDDKDEDSTGARCLYDSLFRDDDSVRETVCRCFDATRSLVERTYGSIMLERDTVHMKSVCEYGNAAAKLAFVLMAIVHEHALSDEIEAEVTSKILLQRIDSFHRLVSIASRSLFESPFTDKNAHVFVARYIVLCALGWMCLRDSASIENLCDMFGYAYPNEARFRRPKPTLASASDLAEIAKLCSSAVPHHAAASSSSSSSSSSTTTASNAVVVQNVFASFRPIRHVRRS
jgi:hypothetical protein